MNCLSRVFVQPSSGVLLAAELANHGECCRGSQNMAGNGLRAAGGIVKKTAKRVAGGSFSGSLSIF